MGCQAYLLWKMKNDLYEMSSIFLQNKKTKQQKKKKKKKKKKSKCRLLPLWLALKLEGYNMPLGMTLCQTF